MGKKWMNVVILNFMSLPQLKLSQLGYSSIT